MDFPGVQVCVGVGWFVELSPRITRRGSACGTGGRRAGALPSVRSCGAALSGLINEGVKGVSMAR
jgi:hypothetical protein